MGAFDTEERKAFELCPEGFFPARLYSIVDMGTHDNPKPDGTIGLKHEVRFTWELPTATMTDGRPFAVSKNYTLTRSKKGSLYIHEKSGTYQLVKKLTGLKDDLKIKFYRLKDLLGGECELETVHSTPNASGKVYANIETVGKLRPGQTCPKAVNPPVLYNLSLGTDNEMFQALPEWQRTFILNSWEATGGLENRIAQLNNEMPANVSAPVAGKLIGEDNIPF